MTLWLVKEQIQAALTHGDGGIIQVTDRGTLEELLAMIELWED